MGKGKDKKGKELDLAGASRGVWLIKVPNYLSEAWKRTSHSDVGLMKINVGQKAQLQFDLSPEVAKEMAVKGNTGDSSGTSALEGPSGTIEIPREHKVHLQSFGNQSMYVFSEDSEGKLAAEGKVVQKAEMQPQQNKMYLQLKKKQMVDAQEPKYQIQQIKETTVSTFKPKSYHQPDVS
jgi:transcription initiation factor TFIIF subunit beta